MSEDGILGRAKDKLIAAKRRWAAEGRLLTGETSDPAAERLPPGQRLVRDWPILDLGVRPRVTQADFRLAIDGLVANPVTWDWSALMAQPQVDLVTDIHCVTAWSRYDNRWQGVAARHILAVARPRAEVRHVVFHSSDGYTTNVRLADFDAPDALIAHAWEGRPLPAEHGGPVRGVIPRLYFWKSAKWVRRIEFLAQDRPGFWEVRGYHNRGDPWMEERYG